MTPATGPVAAAGAVCRLPGQHLRGVTFTVARPLTARDAKKGVTLDVEVHDGPQVVRSGRYMGSTVAAGTTLTVAVAGEGLPTTGDLVTSIAATGAAQPLYVGGRAGAVNCAPVRPTADGLRLVFADAGSIIYQRLTALPRVRWASAATVIGSAPARVAALESGVPGDAVVLDSAGPRPAGRPATVSLQPDDDDTITARVAAPAGGYLVVADAHQQPGWSATVAGRRTDLVPADDAMAAVFVPAGSHTVTVSYSTPGQTAGLALSLAGLLALLAVLASPRWLPAIAARGSHRRGRSRRTHRRRRLGRADRPPADRSGPGPGTDGGPP